MIFAKTDADDSLKEIFPQRLLLTKPIGIIVNCPYDDDIYDGQYYITSEFCLQTSDRWLLVDIVFK